LKQDIKLISWVFAQILGPYDIITFTSWN
jgi:hypothetical protein